MSKKATFFLATATLLSVTALGVAGYAWYQAWLNQPLDETTATAPIEIDDVAGVTAQDGDVAFELSPIDEGGNTQLIWRCGKVLAGARFDYAGAWTRFGGRVLVDPQARALRAGELQVAVTAMRGHGESPAPNAMINTVRDNHWFAPAHPTAVLTTRAATPRAAGAEAAFDGAIDGWTHALQCRLQLNGIEQDLTVYARLQIDE
ncbi:MAG: hypothetical protein KAI24_11220, partial [Planctomycetes bacterium]|nr:hypothetical protein [Planctomycetota bacterium]